MSANFTHVESLNALDALFTESHRQPILLFKHSITCGISAGVYREVSEVDADIHVITMQTGRDISNAVADKTGVRHQSPQAIVLVNGEAEYHASHYDITAGDIETVLQQK